MDTNIVLEIALVALAVLSVVLVTLAIYFLPKLVKLVENKIGIDIPPAAEKHLQTLAISAIGYGEEFAHQWLQSAAEKVPQKLKMEKSADWFKEHAADLVTDWTTDQVRKYLESQLGVVRLQAAAGATKAVAATSVNVIDPGADPGIVAGDVDDIITQEMDFDATMQDLGE